MRIDEIQFENFRKFVNTSVKFEYGGDNDIHVIIAENGAGKTTFLNAMTWCLYYSEPKIKDKENALPTLNTEVSNNSEKEFEEASVSITVSDNDSKLIFKRSDIYKIHGKHSEYYKKNNKREEWIDQDFSVTEKTDKGSNVHRKREDCDNFVASFIPENIKEFFFFDGEQLENYFLISKAIKEQVFTLSQIFVLDEMHRRLNSKLGELRKEGSPNSNSDDKLKEYNEKSALLENELKRYDSLNEKYGSLLEEMDNLINSLGNAPSIAKTEELRDKKIVQLEENKNSLKRNKKSLNDLIIKEAPKIFAKSAFIDSLNLIEENKDESYIYPIDESVLEDSIKEHSCKVCDREIDDDLINILENKRAKLYLIAPEDKILSENKKFFNEFTKVSKNYLNKEQEIQNDINTFENNIQSLESDIDELYKTLELNKDLKNSINRRDELVKMLPDKKSDLDSLDKNNQVLKVQVEKLHNEYLNLVSEEKEYKGILAKINLCNDALEVIDTVKEDMVAETRKIIQDATNEKFFNLIRKSKTYGRIEITDDYKVKLYDEDGRAASSTASASEVELLALAFILAIHSVSGFESPLVVDTLLARTSGQQRLNVSQSCLNVSAEKQLLLFLIDEEYTSPVKKLFMKNNVLEYKLVESSSEKEIKIKGV